MKYILTTALTLTLLSCAPKMIVASGEKVIIPIKNKKLTDEQLKNWSHLDLMKDTVPGLSLDRAYAEVIKSKKGTKVIVGVIDSGVDVEHKDLRSHIWVNQNEIPNNQIDDDKNNFADDIHGWNFLGDIVHENLEFVRVLREADKDSEIYKKAQEKYEEKYSEVIENKKQLDFIVAVKKGISEHLKKEDYTLAEVKAIKTTDGKLSQYKEIMIRILGKSSKAEFDKQIQDFEDHVNSQVNNHLNLELNSRKLLGDNHNDIADTKYGNNNVIGPDKKEAKHGTHVAGIIVKSFGKNNNLNTSNIQIMAVRAVPDGDEYDKDIALAIRYAADNGAKVINTSFGKEFSPKKEWVYDAIKYAASKDVLIVNAAGNDTYNIDEIPVYPNDADYSNNTEVSDNFLTVGALNYVYGSELLAEFSNYGKVHVDVFAPGVKIYATTPNNEYEFLSGTSMAAPSVAGVAALIRSYYPKLSASEVKHILMDSGLNINKEVSIGGDASGIKMPFAETCKSGRMVNAYNALLLAKKVAAKK